MNRDVIEVYDSVRKIASKEAMKLQPKSKWGIVAGESSDGVATVVIDDNDTTTECELLVGVHHGDRVMVSMAPGSDMPTVTGNFTNPAVDDKSFMATKYIAEEANKLLDVVSEAADKAGTTVDDIMAKAAEAGSGVEEIKNYVGMAEDYDKTLTQRVEESANSIEQIKGAVESAEESAGAAADSARQASQSAIKAESGLARVQDVVGVTNWLAEHSAPTADTVAQEGKDYYSRNPETGALTLAEVSPGEPVAGMWELSQSVQNYIASYLALVDEVLKLSNGGNARAELSSNALRFIDADERELASIGAEGIRLGSLLAQNIEISEGAIRMRRGTSTRLKVGGDAIDFYNGYGESTALFDSSGVRIGLPDGVCVKAIPEGVFFYDGLSESTAEFKGECIRIGKQNSLHIDMHPSTVMLMNDGSDVAADLSYGENGLTLRFDENGDQQINVQHGVPGSNGYFASFEGYSLRSEQDVYLSAGGDSSFNGALALDYSNRWVDVSASYKDNRVGLNLDPVSKRAEITGAKLYCDYPIYIGDTPVMRGIMDDSGYFGLVSPAGNDDGFIRATAGGLIPYDKSGEDSSYLGTANWRWKAVYGVVGNFSGRLTAQYLTLGGHNMAPNEVFAGSNVVNVTSGSLAAGATQTVSATVTVASGTTSVAYAVTALSFGNPTGVTCTLSGTTATIKCTVRNMSSSAHVVSVAFRVFTRRYAPRT